MRPELDSSGNDGLGARFDWYKTAPDNVGIGSVEAIRIVFRLKVTDVARGAEVFP